MSSHQLNCCSIALVREIPPWWLCSLPGRCIASLVMLSFSLVKMTMDAAIHHQGGHTTTREGLSLTKEGSYITSKIGHPTREWFNSWVGVVMFMGPLAPFLSSQPSCKMYHFRGNNLYFHFKYKKTYVAYLIFQIFGQIRKKSNINR